MTVVVRPATPADAAAIAEVHVRTWQAGYTGQLPADFLDTMSVRRSQDGWEQRLNHPFPGSATLVADQDGTIAGFVNVGPTQDDDVTQDTGVVYAIYVAPTHWRSGLGRQLFAAALESLRENGFRRAALWVLRSNDRAREFYARMGWKADGAERTEIMRDVQLDEIRYTHDLT